MLDLEKPQHPESQRIRHTIVLRVGPRREGYNKRPSLSLWANEKLGNDCNKGRDWGKGKAFSSNKRVSDMPICTASHGHEAIGEINELCLCRVPSIIRFSERQEKCSICTERGCVSPVQRLLLTQTNVFLTTLVLAPVLSQSPKGKERRVQEVNEMYQTLGLL
jgi:hypothetical protein